MIVREFILSAALAFCLVSCLVGNLTAYANGPQVATGHGGAGTDVPVTSLTEGNFPPANNSVLGPVTRGAGRGVAQNGEQGGGAAQQNGQQQATAARGAAAGGAGGGGAGGGGATYKHNEMADKSMEYGKAARESVNKSLDKFGEGVKSLQDGFKESLAAVSKLPEDNAEIMKNLRQSVDNIAKRSAEPIGADAVAKFTEEIDKHGQTLVDIVTKRAQSFAAAAPGARPAPAGGNIGQALQNKGGGGNGGLELASTANVPNANQIPSFGGGSNTPGPFGGTSRGIASPANSLDFSLKGTYNPPAIR